MLGGAQPLTRLAEYINARRSREDERAQDARRTVSLVELHANRCAAEEDAERRAARLLGKL